MSAVLQARTMVHGGGRSSRAAHLLRFVALALLAAALAGCTIVFEARDDARVRPGVVVSTGPIRHFAPTRGTDSTYRVGEPISFQIRTAEDGYVTLTAIDPDGLVYVFARNLSVRAGRTEVISGLSPRQQFVVVPPVGLHRVSAHFTPSRTNERVEFRGVAGYDTWQSQIRIELQPFPNSEVVQTRFFVRP